MAKKTLQGGIRNSPFAQDFLVSRIFDNGILSSTFLNRQKCDLCLYKGVLAWNGETIPLINKHGKLLVSKVQTLGPTVRSLGVEPPVGCRLPIKPNQPVKKWYQGGYQDSRAANVCRQGAGRRILLCCINTTVKQQELRVSNVVSIYTLMEENQIWGSQSVRCCAGTHKGQGMEHAQRI